MIPGTVDVLSRSRSAGSKSEICRITIAKARERPTVVVAIETHSFVANVVVIGVTVVADRRIVDGSMCIRPVEPERAPPLVTRDVVVVPAEVAEPISRCLRAH